MSPRAQPSPLDATFAALAHPARRRMLTRLRRGPARVTELAKRNDLSLPSVSRHIKVLEAAGMLRRERHGREILLALQKRPGENALTWLRRHQQFWDEQMDAFESYSAELAVEEND